MCELTLLVHVVGTESTLPPICGCVLVVAGTGERALLRFNTHTHTAVCLNIGGIHSGLARVAQCERSAPVRVERH